MKRRTFLLTAGALAVEIGCSKMQINNPGVLDGSVTTAKIANLAVTTAKIADGAVTDAKITGPVSEANGGTGAASLIAAKLMTAESNTYGSFIGGTSGQFLSFPVSATGFYLVTVTANFQETSSNAGTAWFAVSGSTVAQYGNFSSDPVAIAASASIDLTRTFLVQANAGDTLVITGNVGGGSTSATFTGNVAIIRYN